MSPQLTVRLAALRLAQGALHEQIDRFARSNIVYRAERIEGALRAIQEIDELLVDLEAAADQGGAAVERARRAG